MSKSKFKFIEANFLGKKNGLLRSLEEWNQTRFDALEVKVLEPKRHLFSKITKGIDFSDEELLCRNLINEFIASGFKQMVNPDLECTSRHVAGYSVDEEDYNLTRLESAQEQVSNSISDRLCSLIVPESKKINKFDV